MQSFTIVGYTFAADIYCEHCTAVMFEEEHGPSIFDGAEAILDVRATERGIDRMEERTFDSGDFPKVVFADSVEDDERCGQCGQPLI